MVMSISKIAVPSFVLLFLLMLATKVKAVLNCTTPTTACPQTETRWKDREKLFNCGMQRYTCLLTENKDLVEVCMWNSLIKEGMLGCPFIAHCDKKYGAILISEDRYSSCPEHLDGCPKKSHKGYHISDIYKYYRCLYIDRESSTSSLHTDMTTSAPSPNSQRGNPVSVFTIVFTCIAIIVIITVVTITFCIIVRRRTMLKANLKKNKIQYDTVQQMALS